MRRLVGLALKTLVVSATFASIISAQSAPPLAPPIHVKVVVVAMFERGEDTGDAPGEYQLWVEREHLDQVFDLPAAYHHVRMNKDGVLGMLTGVGTAKAAASVMAVGLDPRFDLSKAYWIVAGIGGGDPADVSLGSAVWADHVIDSDLAYEIDAREIPKDWPTGYVPVRRSRPYEPPARPDADGEIFTPNAPFVLGVSTHERCPARRFRPCSSCPSTFRGFPECRAPAFRHTRRRTLRRNLLVWGIDGSVG